MEENKEGRSAFEEAASHPPPRQVPSSAPWVESPTSPTHYAYDTFDRPASDSLGVADSGHPWTEAAGDLDITASGLASGAGASVEGIGVVDLGVQEVFEGLIRIQTIGEGNTRCGIVFRYTDPDNYLLLQVRGATLAPANGHLALWKCVGGGFTQLASEPFAAALNGSIALLLYVKAYGGVIFGKCWEPDANSSDRRLTVYQSTISDSWNPLFQRGWGAGVRLNTAAEASDQVHWIQLMAAAPSRLPGMRP